MSKNKSLISLISKTIMDNSKSCRFWFGFTIDAKILDLILTNYTAHGNQESEEVRHIRIEDRKLRVLSLFHLKKMRIRI